uniref:DUF6488 family protein n=1 Tax=Orrella sp. TaxID=1921583 RepID=UPI0040555E25
MKRLILATLLAFPMIAPTIAMADPGSRCHFHGKKLAAESTVLQCASQRKASLIEAGKLEKIWASVQQASIDLVDGKKAKECGLSIKTPRPQTTPSPLRTCSLPRLAISLLLTTRAIKEKATPKRVAFSVKKPSLESAQR